MITLFSLFYSFWIVLGVFMVAKYINMVRYQWIYGGNAGEAYIHGKLKEYLEDKVLEKYNVHEIEVK